MNTPERFRHNDGVAAVEFGLIASLLFLILFGIIEFGQFYSEYQVMQGAAREGARLASVRAAPADVITRVHDAADPYDIDDGADPISVSVAGGGSQCTSASQGSRVEVQWKESFDISMPFVPAIDVDLDVKGVFRCE